MPRRTTLILACRDGHSHRMVLPPLVRAGDHTTRMWVGVVCTFGGVERIHCLAPDPQDPTGQRVVQETCEPGLPYLWPDDTAAQAALARWLEQDE